MADQQDILFNNLKEIIPKSAYGPNLNMFVIALEGWRRGLSLKFYTKTIKNRLKIRYALSNGEKEVQFQLSLAEHVPKESRKITRSKTITKEYLDKAGIPIPKGRSFTSKHSDQEVIDYANRLGYPLIIKPGNASLGIGVTININDEKTFAKSLRELRESRKDKDDEVIVERHVSGYDTRVFVVGDQVAGAFRRVPANVIGDGKQTIEQLIEKKNKERLKNPHINGSQILVNEDTREFLKKNNYQLNSVPPKGERVFLTSNPLPSLGGDTREVMNELTPETKKVAVNAVKTLDGLSVCGVDIMIDNEGQTNHVLELNSRPNIGGSLFPVEGTPNNVAGKIIDYYFPETASVNMKERKYHMYFDYEKIEEILRAGYAHEVVVPPYPLDDFVAKKLTVSGKVQGVGFRNWVFKTASGRRINGYIKNLKNGNVLIIAAGKEKDVEDFIHVVKTKKTSKIKVTGVKEQDWTEPVKIGFDVIKSQPNVRRLRNELNSLKKKNKELEDQKVKVMSKLKRLEGSSSWKLTAPMRKVVGVMKRK